MNKFKVGDRVECVEVDGMAFEALVVGLVYTVSGICNAKHIHLLETACGAELGVGWENRRFRLAETPKTEAEIRKGQPVFRGVVGYFPDALAAVAEISRIGNDQHNPGQPMHWAYGKSMDHKDCILRHLADSGELDTDGALHDAKAAWRALANLQTILETRDPALHARRQAQRELAKKGER